MSTAVPNAAKLLARMNDLEHQAVEKEFIGLFYGDKGTRKTTTAQGLAQKLRGNGQILFVDSADGWVSLERFKSLTKNTQRIRVDDPRELMVLSKALRTRAKGYEDFTVVVLDEYSSWWTDTLHSYAFEKAGLDPATDELPEIDWTWYGPPQQAMLNVFKNFHKTPGLHVIVVAHEQGRVSSGEIQARFTPLLGTKLSAGMGQLAHLFGRFEGRKVGSEYKVEVQIQPTRFVEAKSRLSNTNETKLSEVALVNVISEWVGGGAPKAPVKDMAEEPESDDDEDFAVEDDEG